MLRIISYVPFVTNEMFIFINLYIIFCSMTDIESVEEKN